MHKLVYFYCDQLISLIQEGMCSSLVLSTIHIFKYQYLLIFFFFIEVLILETNLVNLLHLVRLTHPPMQSNK
jgi:hypothetical protein